MFVVVVVVVALLLVVMYAVFVLSATTSSGAVMYVRSKPKLRPHFDHKPYIPKICQSISYTKHMNSVGVCQVCSWLSPTSFL